MGGENEYGRVLITVYNVRNSRERTTECLLSVADLEICYIRNISQKQAEDAGQPDVTGERVCMCVRRDTFKRLVQFGEYF